MVDLGLSMSPNQKGWVPTQDLLVWESQCIMKERTASEGRS